MKKVMLIFGTRPEAIKMCPVVLALRRRAEIQTLVCVTGQHKQMLSQVLDAFSITPDYDLAIMKERQTLFDITRNILGSIGEVLERERPDLVLVHGDTTTTFAAALSCFYLQIPVGHVEAGLRTHDLTAPFPEEFNRKATSIVASLNFAPTELARQNLLAEGYSPASIVVTGNTAIDALNITVRQDYRDPVTDWVGKSRLILLTAHRRENLGEPMRRIFRAIKRIVTEFPDVKVVYPVHMNPAVREPATEILGACESVRLIEPLDVIAFHNLMARANLILTDSGGIQEEAPSLGKPVLVLRDVTERPEGIDAGTLKLIGTDEEQVYTQSVRLLTDKAEYARMSGAKNPYGDGLASERIADAVCAWENKNRKAETRRK